MKKKGSRIERELVNLLWDLQCPAIRVPSSGAATKRPLPDIIAGNGRRYMAIEVKGRKEFPIYLSDDEVNALKEFSASFGAMPFVGFRLDYKEWRFIDVEDLKPTKKGNFKIDEDLMYEKSIDVFELVGVSRQKKLHFLKDPE
jgi:Holliday junction resolvase